MCLLPQWLTRADPDHSLKSAHQSVQSLSQVMIRLQDVIPFQSVSRADGSEHNH